MKNVANTFDEMVNLMSEGEKDIVTDLEYVYSDGLRVINCINLIMLKIWRQVNRRKRPRNKPAMKT